ncbi:MAG TPA: RNA polymerase sigma factor [Gammaproteobacteria bacterium]|nr:RNA polymerase sigma factor [Gammaproteobacteria bacterium]
MPNLFDQHIDETIVQQARRGDRNAHETLYTVFAAPVHTLAWRLTARREVADEVMQETFIEMIRSIADYRGDGTIGPWIRRIAVSKCLMHFRSAWRRLRDDREPVELDQLAATSVDGAVELELERLLARLPETPRTVVWLHDVEGYTHREIGELMNKTASFSKSQLARAHAVLRSAVAPQSENSQEVPCTPQSLSY